MILATELGKQIRETINNHLAQPVVFPETRRKRVKFNGYDLSIQASEYHYSTPRINNANSYEEVEVGFPKFNFPTWFIEKYAEDPESPQETVYPYVPIDDLVQALYEVLT